MTEKLLALIDELEDIRDRINDLSMEQKASSVGSLYLDFAYSTVGEAQDDLREALADVEADMRIQKEGAR